MNTKPNPATPAPSRPQLEAKRKVFKKIFSGLNGEKIAFLNKIASDGPTRKEKREDIIALIGTGIYSKEDFVDFVSKIPTSNEQDLQIEVLNAWITSDASPAKEVCLSLMNAFAKEKGHLVAEIIFSRRDYFSEPVLARMLIDNEVNLTEDCYMYLSSQIERFI
jgi:hypothetical protein